MQVCEEAGEGVVFPGAVITGGHKLSVLGMDPGPLGNMSQSPPMPHCKDMNGIFHHFFNVLCNIQGQFPTAVSVRQK